MRILRSPRNSSPSLLMAPMVSTAIGTKHMSALVERIWLFSCLPPFPLQLPTYEMCCGGKTVPSCQSLWHPTWNILLLFYYYYGLSVCLFVNLSFKWRWRGRGAIALESPPDERRIGSHFVIQLTINCLLIHATHYPRLLSSVQMHIRLEWHSTERIPPLRPAQRSTLIQSTSYPKSNSQPCKPANCYSFIIIIIIIIRLLTHLVSFNRRIISAERSHFKCCRTRDCTVQI